MAIALDSQIEWKTAAPLWGTLPLDPTYTQQVSTPALLGFHTDSFMVELTNLLHTASCEEQLAERFVELRAKRESFRAPPTGAPPGWSPLPTPLLKLYQPTHGCFYLVAANLVCHMPGLPDRAINVAGGEKVSFVLRRLSPSGQEMAWVSDVTQQKHWKPVVSASQVEPNEQLFPMSQMNFTLNNRKRRLLFGLVPTSSYETYQAASILSSATGTAGVTGIIGTTGEAATGDASPFDTTVDRRKDEMYSRIIEPITNMSSYTETPERVEQTRIATQFILLDFAVFLQSHLPTLWTALQNPGNSPPPDLTAVLYALLKTPMLLADPSHPELNIAITWQEALLLAFASAPAINEGILTPPFMQIDLTFVDYVVAGITKQNPVGILELYMEMALMQYPLSPAGNSSAPAAGNSSVLAGGTGSLLPAIGTTPAETPSLPKFSGQDNTRYVLRCVYQRPQCEAFCPDVVSEATEAFALAPYFDADAPGRPIRISLPFDTSIAGLRKYRQNVSFIMSNALRRQVDSMTSLSDTLNGKVNSSSGGPNFGTICSFSIPIITICALIVLMLFLYLLNIIFWWLPFIRICFPLKWLKSLFSF